MLMRSEWGRTGRLEIRVKSGTHTLQILCPTMCRLSRSRSNKTNSISFIVGFERMPSTSVCSHNGLNTRWKFKFRIWRCVWGIFGEDSPLKLSAFPKSESKQQYWLAIAQSVGRSAETQISFESSGTIDHQVRMAGDLRAFVTKLQYLS